MKKQDIPADIFDLLSNYMKEKLESGKDIEYSSHFWQDIQKDMSPEMKERIIDFIIQGFPDLSKESPEKQANFFATWRHDAQMNTGFIYDWKKHTSDNALLNPKYIGVGLKLADFLAKKTVEIGDARSAFSIEQVLQGFIDYNWDRLQEGGFDAPLVVPPAFRDPAFIKLVSQNAEKLTGQEIKSFCLAETPREWLRELVKNNKGVKGILTPLPMVTWNKIFKKQPWLDIQQHLIPVDSDESFKRTQAFQEMRKQSAKGKTDGIFVDIDGTLIQNGELNEYLYNNLCVLSEYKKVTIFTGADIERQKKRLAELGVDIKKFAIEPKDKYRGHLFSGIIIDDVAPEMQGFITEDEDVYCPIKMAGFALERTLQEAKSHNFKGDSFKKAWKDSLFVARIREKDMHVDRLLPDGRLRGLDFERRTLQRRYLRERKNARRDREELVLKLHRLRQKQRSLPKMLRQLTGGKKAELKAQKTLVQRFYDEHSKLTAAKKSLRDSLIRK